MKRYNGLYEQICSFENLVAAAYRAKRGKRNRPDVTSFHFHQETELHELREELMDKQYRPGDYRSFWIRDPKRRLISAAPYRDRIVHHALCRVIEPIFERGFIHASYANRTGKGTHKALDLATHFARGNKYALKCDIEKYFPSIDHGILLERIERKIKCRDTLWLIERIVANSNTQEEIVRYFPGDDLFTPWERRRGIPIGNLTSQFFANVYLDGFDHFVKERLGCANYVRSGAEAPRRINPALQAHGTTRSINYVRFADDFLVFANDKAWLGELPERMRECLDPLRLTMHPRKCQVTPVSRGVPFLGWQVYPDHRRLRRATGVRIQRSLKQLVEDHGRGAIGFDRVQASVQSWIGHLRHGDTWGLRRRLFAKAVFKPERRIEA